MSGLIQSVFIFLLVTCLSACAFSSKQANQPELNIVELQQSQRQQQIKLKQADMLYKQGNLTAAKALLLEYVKLDDKQPYAWYRLGTIEFKQRQFESALEAFNKVVKLNPRDAKAHYNMAVIYLLLSQNHFKYYSATVKPDVDISAISKLLVDIDGFNNANR